MVLSGAARQQLSLEGQLGDQHDLLTFVPNIDAHEAVGRSREHLQRKFGKALGCLNPHDLHVSAIESFVIADEGARVSSVEKYLAIVPS